MDTDSPIGTLFLEKTDKKEIEALARQLTTSQFLELLDHCAELDAGMRQRLDPLLAGLSHQVFSDSLTSLSPAQKQLLCRVADDAPLQYHLTLLLHELANQAEACAERVEGLTREIGAYDISKVSQADVEAFRHRIQQANEFFRVALEKVDVALMLAWNTTREELIDKLTTLKENWLRYVASELGTSAADAQPARGLYLLIDEHFGAIYSGTNDSHPLAGLADEDRALEALAALSIWYVEDYWEIGLLPGIARPEELQRDPAQYDQKARQEHRERLMALARENLARLGLKTVADLKNQRLYSRRILMRFVQAHKSDLEAFTVE